MSYTGGGVSRGPPPGTNAPPPLSKRVPAGGPGPGISTQLRHPPAPQQAVVVQKAGHLASPQQTKSMAAFRSLELCELLKCEIEHLSADISAHQAEREEYEKKFRQQLAEMDRIQHMLKQLQEAHILNKQTYEDEIILLRRQLDSHHSQHPQSQSQGGGSPSGTGGNSGSSGSGNSLGGIGSGGQSKPHSVPQGGSGSVLASLGMDNRPERLSPPLQQPHSSSHSHSNDRSQSGNSFASVSQGQAIDPPMAMHSASPMSAGGALPAPLSMTLMMSMTSNMPGRMTRRGPSPVGGGNFMEYSRGQSGSNGQPGQGGDQVPVQSVQHPVEPVSKRPRLSERQLPGHLTAFISTPTSSSPPPHAHHEGQQQGPVELKVLVHGQEGTGQGPQENQNQGHLGLAQLPGLGQVSQGHVSEGQGQQLSGSADEAHPKSISVKAMPADMDEDQGPGGGR
ncbi:unnamed protein product, partial [Choristocarpus tenellus]